MACSPYFGVNPENNTYDVPEWLLEHWTSLWILLMPASRPSAYCLVYRNLSSWNCLTHKPILWAFRVGAAVILKFRDSPTTSNDLWAIVGCLKVCIICVNVRPALYVFCCKRVAFLSGQVIVLLAWTVLDYDGACCTDSPASNFRASGLQTSYVVHLVFDKQHIRCLIVKSIFYIRCS